MAKRHARCIAALLYLAAVPARVAAQDADRNVLETIADGVKSAYTLAVLISGARMQANSHYPTDLIAGATLGVLAGRAATFELGGRRVQFAPAVTKSGGLLLSGSMR